MVARRPGIVSCMSQYSRRGDLDTSKAASNPGRSCCSARSCKHSISVVRGELIIAIFLQKFSGGVIYSKYSSTPQTRQAHMEKATSSSWIRKVSRKIFTFRFPKRWHLPIREHCLESSVSHHVTRDSRWCRIFYWLLSSAHIQL